MNIKKLSIIVFLLLFILFGSISAIVYDKSESASVDIICYADSYAEKYAKKHDIHCEVISDSDAYIGILNLENFDYNFDGSIVSYTGESETIAIPDYIEDTKIIKVKEKAFENAENLKNIYIPKSLEVFEPKNLENVTVYMYEDTALYKKLSKDKKIGFAIKTVSDSYFVDFYNSYIPFSYNNISDKTIDINRYNDSDDFVLIPESIGGKTVTAISFDALSKGVKTILIPKSVTAINKDLYKSKGRYDIQFLIGMLIALVGTIIAVLFLLTVSIKTKEQAFLSISQIITVYTLFILSLLLSGLYVFVPLIPKWAIYVAVAVVYGFAIVCVLKAKTAIVMVESVEQNIKAKTQFIKDLTIDAQNLTNRANTLKLKAHCKKVYEAVRYSDPMSSEELSDIENHIKDEFATFTDAVISDDLDLTESSAKELLNLIEERNIRCKRTK